MSETAANSVTLRFLAAPTDVGHSGSVDAGTVLEWVDKAAYAAAVGWAKSYCVTAYVGNIHFADPVNSGDMVEVEATIVYTGRSSMHIRTSSPPGTQGRPGHHAQPVHGDLRGRGRGRQAHPRAQFEPVTAGEIEQRDHALARIKVREQIVEAMNAQEYTDAGTAERVVLRFMAAPTDVNWGGKVHGGIVMKWIDEAAYVCASRYCGQGHRSRVLRRRPLLPSAADRPRGGSGGPAGLHRDQGHAHRRPRPLRATPRAAN